MRLIGLCGRSGSGKGCFCDIARENGIKVIDCDAVYKELVSSMSPCLLEIAENFGSSVIKDNALDRRVLAPIVFADREKLALLNKITHKHIYEEIKSILAECNGDDTVILDAPTLFESGIDKICDLIVGIIAPDDACVLRITLRDGLSESEARMRLSNQLENGFVIEHSDIIVYNYTDFDEFTKTSLELIKKLKEGDL